jgi:hypothetical protein
MAISLVRVPFTHDQDQFFAILPNKGSLCHYWNEIDVSARKRNVIRELRRIVWLAIVKFGNYNIEDVKKDPDPDLSGFSPFR